MKLFDDEYPQLDVVLNGTPIRCDVLEPLFDPARYLSTHLSKEYQVNFLYTNFLECLFLQLKSRRKRIFSPFITLTHIQTYTNIYIV